MKNNEKLLDEIGALDDELVPDLNPKKKKTPLKIAITAGLLAATVAGFFVVRNLNSSVPWEEYQIYTPYDYKSEIVINELEQVRYIIPNRGTDWYSEGEASHSTYIGNNIENYSDSNPWKNMEYTELPVFRNKAFDDYNLELTSYFPEEELRRIGENIVDILGLTIDETQTQIWKNGNNDINGLFLKCTGEAYDVDMVEITVYGDGSVRVEFNPDNGEVLSMSELPHYKLPDEYSFTTRDTSDEEAEKSLAYLSDKFKNLLQFENPVYDTYITLDDYMNKSRVYRVHEGSDDPIQNLLNYHLASAEFHCLDGQLWYITLQNYFGFSEYRGMYPTITPERAKELLLSGSYLTNLPQSLFKGQVINAEDVKNVDLVYYYAFDEYFAPMYRFFVELDWKSNYPESESVYSHYGEVFVPAIEGQYVTTYGLMPDFTGDAASSFPDTELTMPDGSTVTKDDAVAAYGNSGEPIIEFNFGFLRYCDPVFQSTTDDIESFDFETGSFKEPINIALSDPQYFKVQAGDVLENGMTVTTADTKLIWKDGKAQLYQSSIQLDVDCVYEGAMFCEHKENYREGLYDVNFYPDTRGETPVLATYTPDYNVDAEKMVLEKAALISSGGKFFITNIHGAVPGDYSIIVGGTRTVKVRAQVYGITYYVDDEGVYSTMKCRDVDVFNGYIE